MNDVNRTNTEQPKSLAELAQVLMEGHSNGCAMYEGRLCNCEYGAATVDIIEPACDAAALIESLQAEVERLTTLLSTPSGGMRRPENQGKSFWK